MEQRIHTEQHQHTHEAHLDPIAPPERPVASRWWKFIMAAGNGAIAAAQILAAKADAVTGTTDAAHNGFEMLLAGTLAENATNNNLSPHTKERLRKASYWGISTIIGGLGMKAGVDYFQGHEAAAHEANLYASGASLGLSAYLTTTLQLNVNRLDRLPNAYEKDLLKHCYSVDLPLASAAFAGAVLQKYGIYGYEQLLAVVSSGRATWAFRPTKKNLSHDCPVHGGHSHGHDHAHEHETHTARSGWLKQSLSKLSERISGRTKKRAIIGLGAASLVLMSGLFSPEATSEHDVSRPGAAAEKAPTLPDIVPPKPAPIEQPATHECRTITVGDSQWSIVEDQLNSIMGEKPSAAAIDTVTDHVVVKNKIAFPNPNHITPGQCLQVPTASTIQTLVA